MPAQSSAEADPAHLIVVPSMRLVDIGDDDRIQAIARVRLDRDGATACYRTYRGRPGAAVARALRSARARRTVRLGAATPNTVLP
jgi:hypothetical protein